MTYTFDEIPKPLPIFRPLLDEQGKPVVRRATSGEFYFAGNCVHQSAETKICEYPIYTSEYPPSDTVQVELTGELREPIVGDLFLTSDLNILECLRDNQVCDCGLLGKRRPILRVKK